jgi:hypothetical protein
MDICKFKATKSVLNDDDDYDNDDDDYDCDDYDDDNMHMMQKNKQTMNSDWCLLAYDAS